MHYQSEQDFPETHITLKKVSLLQFSVNVGHIGNDIQEISPQKIPLRKTPRLHETDDSNQVIINRIFFFLFFVFTTKEITKATHFSVKTNLSFCSSHLALVLSVWNNLNKGFLLRNCWNYVMIDKDIRRRNWIRRIKLTI